jgi:hypothetical protein
MANGLTSVRITFDADARDQPDAGARRLAHRMRGAAADGRDDACHRAKHGSGPYPAATLYA